jgi:hypothetical protein
MPDPEPHIVIGATPEIYQAIGRVAEAWAHLEQATDWAIWETALLNNDAGACITSHLQSLNRRLQALMALIRLRLQDDNSVILTRLNKFIGLTDGLAKERNRAVHDPWISVDDVPGRFQETAEKRLEFGFRPDTAERLLKLVDQINAAQQELYSIKRAFELSSHEKPSPPSSS